MIYKGPLNEYLKLDQIHSEKCLEQPEVLESSLTFVWFNDTTKLVIDNETHTFHQNEIVCLTEFHQIADFDFCNARMIRFNRSFYCVIDHDTEVGCVGILFFGASQLPVLKIPEEDLDTFRTIWKMFEIEMQSNDNLQLEMLQSMLKRFIILSTRIYKKQHGYLQIDILDVDIVRAYNFLVEKHFRTVHTVASYAGMLHKTPKTLSSLFLKLAAKTPLQFIQDRKLLEAKRLLKHTDKSIKEIAFEIGFEDIQTFGRFFKNYTGESPTYFKESKI